MKELLNILFLYAWIVAGMTSNMANADTMMMPICRVDRAAGNLPDSEKPIIDCQKACHAAQLKRKKQLAKK
jgi:hypothetical protein